MRLRVIALGTVLAASSYAAEQPKLFAEISRERPITVGGFDSTVPQFVDGDSWQTKLIFTNLKPSTAYFRIFFLSNQGQPLVFDFVGLGRASSISGELSANQTAEITTVGSAAALTEGWVSVANYDRPATQAGAQVVSIQIGGYAIFAAGCRGFPIRRRWCRSAPTSRRPSRFPSMSATDS